VPYLNASAVRFLHCFVLFFSRPRSEGWPHHGCTFSIYPCPLSFWLTLPRRVLSTSWCCPSRPCVAFLACVHLSSFLALSLSPGNSLASSWCDHSMLASLLLIKCMTFTFLTTTMTASAAAAAAAIVQQPFNGLCSGTTRVGRYQKKHYAFCLSIGLCCVQAWSPHLLSSGFLWSRGR